MLVPHRVCRLLGAAIFLAPFSTFAADRGLAVETSRLARENLRDARQSGGPKAMVAAPQPEVSWTMGLAYDEDESNIRVTNTPFEFSWKGTGENWWAFKINSDGYGTIDPAGGSSQSGLLNAKLSAWYKLNPNFIGSVSLSIPTRGDVGSQDYGQGAKLIFIKDVASDWNFKGLLSLSHSDATQQPGVSQWSQGVLGSLTYALKNDRSVALSLVRSFQDGAPSTTDLSIEYDFSIPKSKVDFALSLSCGLTDGPSEFQQAIDAANHQLLHHFTPEWSIAATVRGLAAQIGPDKAPIDGHNDIIIYFGDSSQDPTNGVKDALGYHYLNHASVP